MPVKKNPVPKLDPAIVEQNKRIIIERFLKEIKGKKPDIVKYNSKHDGKTGHWLEHAMGLKANSSNTPDILGFEMKNATTSKTSFGDWSADFRIFSKKSGGMMTQDEFLRIFGQPNTDHAGRFAWSGRICPNKVGVTTFGGQKLIVNSDLSISAIYDYSKDTRTDKQLTVPIELQRDGLILAKWSSDLMRKRVESKFNQNGWFKCEVNKKTGAYESIVFGDPITFENWIAYLKAGMVIFDSGMHQGNKRPYANWRSSNNFWTSLVTSRY